MGGALRRPGRHRRHRRHARAALSGRRAAPALARARARARGVPGAAGEDLLARVRGQGACGARDQRARALRCRFGPGRHRPRPSGRGLGRVAVPRDRGDAGRIRCDRGLADPQRPRQRRCGRDVGERAPRRRRGDRELDPRGDGRRRRRHRRCGGAARARADDGPGNGRRAACGRGLRRGARGGPRSTRSTSRPYPATRRERQ